jgi:hypothetical protein
MDQWNAYLGNPPNVDLFPEGNRGYLASATEYHAARHAHGLEGYFNTYAWRPY